MKVIVKFKDDEVGILPNASYDVFTDFMPWCGANDIEYDKYLSKNNMVELNSYRSDCTDELILEFIYCDGRKLKFKCIEDSENLQEDN